MTVHGTIRVYHPILLPRQLRPSTTVAPGALSTDGKRLQPQRPRQPRRQSRVYVWTGLRTARSSRRASTWATTVLRARGDRRTRWLHRRRACGDKRNRPARGHNPDVLRLLLAFVAFGSRDMVAQDWIILLRGHNVEVFGLGRNRYHFERWESVGRERGEGARCSVSWLVSPPCHPRRGVSHDR
jgi:hypothetical protein